MTIFFVSSVADATATPEATSGYDIGNDANDGLSPLDLGGNVGPKLTADFVDGLRLTAGHTFYYNGLIGVTQRTRLMETVTHLPSGNSTLSKIRATTSTAQGIFSLNASSSAFDGSTYTIGALELSEANTGTGSLYLAGNASPSNATLVLNGTKFVDCENRPWRGSGSSGIGGDITATNISFEGSTTSMLGIIESVSIERGATVSIDGIDFDITLSGAFASSQGGINIAATETGANVIIKNVTGSITWAQTTGTVRGISLKEFATYDVRDVNYTLTDTNDSGASTDGMFLQSLTETSASTIVKNFNATVNCSEGHLWLIGVDGGAATMSGIDVDGSVVSGPSGFTSGGLHGPTVGGVAGGTVKNVQSGRTNIGMLAKENTGVVTFSNNSIDHAVSRGYYDKGSPVGAVFDNNTITLEDGFIMTSGGAAALNAGATDDDTPAIGTVFTNNQVTILKGTNTTGAHLTLIQDAQGIEAASTATFANNNYTAGGDPLPDGFNYQASTDLTLVEWNALPEVTNDTSISGQPTLAPVTPQTSSQVTPMVTPMVTNMVS